MSAWQVLFCESCEHHAVELNHFITKAFEDTADDVVTSGMDFHANFAHCRVVGDVVDFVDLDRTVFEHETFLDLLEVAFCQRLIQCYVIQLLDVMARMCECLGEFAVVGEEQQADGVAVEAADRVDTFLASAFDEFHHGVALVWVVACGDDAFRLV